MGATVVVFRCGSIYVGCEQRVRWNGCEGRVGDMMGWLVDEVVVFTGGNGEVEEVRWKMEYIRGVLFLWWVDHLTLGCGIWAGNFGLGKGMGW